MSPAGLGEYINLTAMHLFYCAIATYYIFSYLFLRKLMFEYFDSHLGSPVTLGDLLLVPASIVIVPILMLFVYVAHAIYYFPSFVGFIFERVSELWNWFFKCPVFDWALKILTKFFSIEIFCKHKYVVANCADPVGENIVLEKRLE